jgi:hypothetical protein
MQYETLSELWKSPEWKQASAKFIEGKPCAWCGAKQGDTYTTKNGSIRKLGFAPHHIEKHRWGLPLYNQVKHRLFNQYWKDKQSKPLFLFPPGLSGKEYREQVKADWERNNKEYIKEVFEAEKQRIMDQYINLNDEHIVVLCTRCHYAREKGLVLCKVCGKGYHKPKYEQCWSCNRTSSEEAK